MHDGDLPTVCVRAVPIIWKRTGARAPIWLDQHGRDLLCVRPPASLCPVTMRAELIGHFKACMTEIYLHIDARVADYIRTHPYPCTRAQKIYVTTQAWKSSSHRVGITHSHICARGYNRPCTQKYVGKSQSCMVISGRLIVHAPVGGRSGGSNSDESRQRSTSALRPRMDRTN